MKLKHLFIRIDQCMTLSTASNCVRAQYGALLLDPDRNVVLMDGYNGGPRGGGELCGGNHCLRSGKPDEDTGLEGVDPGTTCVEIGCHHAEMNVICNAAARGTPCAGAWLVVTGEPCLMCAKLIHHAGIIKVIVISNSYDDDRGMTYLRDHGIELEHLTHAQIKERGRALRQKNRKDTTP